MKGYYQSNNLRLAYDPGNFMTNKFKEGITFFEDMSKDFPKPELGIIGITNLIVYNLGDAGRYEGEEIRDDFVVDVDREKGSNYHQRAHFFITYEDGTKEH
jgi:hypothetical protein